MQKYTENTRKSYHVLYQCPDLGSCPPAAFALILVGYITQRSLILLSVSHIFAIFPVNCHAAQEEEAKIKVCPSSCTHRKYWTVVSFPARKIGGKSVW